jgi:hypothetical protein
MSFLVTRFSEQPVPQVEARNSGAWRALGKSQAEIMEPTIERWKDGLDAMLVFVCPTVPQTSPGCLMINCRLVSFRQS